MKKPLLFIAIIASVIIGCKLDESGFNKSSAPGTNTSTPNTNASIVGMWFVKTQITKGSALGIAIDDTTTTFTPKDYFTFKSDKTFIYSEADSASVTTGTYNYNASAKTLALTNDVGTFTVNKVTADSLILGTHISIPAYSTETDVILKFTH
ncbi:copper resistance protein NlpE [Mucilaginibacter corticis]|uniref:Copper resistance protein NlpE n=1 Tax=Mucilaginibacter corticis TaxID=2597670 RepID=A0A556MS12_9SPHI|nr:lipocalin family protein [Mucilaginibacter corticis]TSJ42751.1 copper resistance protein NlpE [Mucilaginibacter corticis]